MARSRIGGAPGKCVTAGKYMSPTVGVAMSSARPVSHGTPVHSGRSAAVTPACRPSSRHECSWPPTRLARQPAPSRGRKPPTPPKARCSARTPKSRSCGDFPAMSRPSRTPQPSRPWRAIAEDSTSPSPGQAAQACDGVVRYARQRPGLCANRSATTCSTAGFQPMPRWLLVTSMSSACRPASRCVQVCQATMPSDRL